MVTHLLVRRVRYTDTPSQSVLSGTGLLCASLVQPLATLSGMRRAKKKSFHHPHDHFAVLAGEFQRAK
jgi:hypothetical protein